MSRGEFAHHVLGARYKGEVRVWFRREDTQVVCHFDIRSGRFISFCGGILHDDQDAEFFDEPWNIEHPHARCVVC